jgi:hypothetical protein
MLCGPSYAVQTNTFGLQASGARTKLVYPVGAKPVQDSVVVYNRTAAAITLSLDVIEETPRADGTYTFGASAHGFAAAVHLAERTVRLGPQQHHAVSVTIARPAHSRRDLYAAITAVTSTAQSSGGVGVQERLAVLVGVTADGRARATGSGTGAERTIAIGLAAALAIAGAAAVALRRRGGLSFGHVARS